MSRTLVAVQAAVSALLFAIIVFTIDQVNVPAADFWKIERAWDVWRYLITFPVTLVALWYNVRLLNSANPRFKNSYTGVAWICLAWFAFVEFWELFLVLWNIGQFFAWTCYQYPWCSAPAIGVVCDGSATLPCPECPDGSVLSGCRMDEYCIPDGGTNYCRSKNVRTEWLILAISLGLEIAMQFMFISNSKQISEDAVSRAKVETAVGARYRTAGMLQQPILTSVHVNSLDEIPKTAHTRRPTSRIAPADTTHVPD